MVHSADQIFGTSALTLEVTVNVNGPREPRSLSTYLTSCKFSAKGRVGRNSSTRHDREPWMCKTFTREARSGFLSTSAAASGES